MRLDHDDIANFDLRNNTEALMILFVTGTESSDTYEVSAHQIFDETLKDMKITTITVKENEPLILNGGTKYMHCSKNRFSIVPQRNILFNVHHLEDKYSIFIDSLSMRDAV